MKIFWISDFVLQIFEAGNRSYKYDHKKPAFEIRNSK